MKNQRLYTSLIIYLIQTLFFIMIGMYLQLHKIYFSILLLTITLITYFLRKIPNLNQNKNYNSKLFNLIEQSDTTNFINYVEQNYKDIKSLENLIYYGKMNVLLYAIGKKNYEVCKYLLKRGYDVNFHNDFCETPLIYAIHYSDYKMVELILNHNPNLELRSLKIKSTPLETAICRNRSKIVEKLLNNGAKFSMSDYKNSCNSYIYITVCSLLTPWDSVKNSIKRTLLKFILFDKKKNLFNLYDKSMAKEINLQIFNTRHYFMENCLSL